MKVLKYQLEYSLVWILSCLARLLPWSTIPFFSRIGGYVISMLFAKRRRLVYENLKQAFPSWEQAERNHVAEIFWRNIIGTALECLRALHQDSSAWMLTNITLENTQILDAALKKGKGVLLHTGHFGNWEFAGARIALAGYPLAVVGRRQRNPYFDRWLLNYRCRTGMTIFNHHQAVRETQKWLRNNGCLGILADQNLYKGGIFVQLLGRPAATTTLTALLHFKLGSPIVGVFPYRKEGVHRIRFENIEIPDDIVSGNLDRAEKVAGATQYLTDRIDSWIRQDPPNWLWGHNRWKRQPEAALAQSVGAAAFE